MAEITLNCFKKDSSIGKDFSIVFLSTNNLIKKISFSILIYENDDLYSSISDNKLLSIFSLIPGIKLTSTKEAHFIKLMGDLDYQYLIKKREILKQIINKYLNVDIYEYEKILSYNLPDYKNFLEEHDFVCDYQ